MSRYLHRNATFRVGICFITSLRLPFFLLKTCNMDSMGPDDETGCCALYGKRPVAAGMWLFFSLSLIPCPFILSSLSPGILRAFSFGYHNRYVEKIENGPRDLFSVDHHHVFFFFILAAVAMRIFFFFLSLKILRKPRLHSRIYFSPKRIWPDSMC